MYSKTLKFIGGMFFLAVWISACTGTVSPSPSLDNETTILSATSTKEPTLTSTPTQEIIQTQQTSTPIPQVTCALGLGLRRETAELIIDNRNHPGLVMTGSSNMAESYFPQLDGWTRVIGAPSLESMQHKANRADTNHTPYEILAYGLETSATTPQQEWQNLELATKQSKKIAAQFKKLLLVGPGFRLMSENEDQYAPMASHADIWVIQTQRLQSRPPGPEYRQEVERVVSLIRAGNPDISIWAQINLLPDQEPDAERWLDYHAAIEDIVDGSYIGVYTWGTEDEGKLVATIETIYSTLCGNGM